MAGVSPVLNGVFETKTQKSPRRVPQQSVRFKITIDVIFAEAPRSTCHQGFASELVWVTEPLKKTLSVLPSTAEEAAAPVYPGSVLLCVAAFPSARLEEF